MAEVTVERQSTDGLEKQEWRFLVATKLGGSTIHLVLDEYYHATRPTKRHGWRTQENYSRLFRSNSTIKDPTRVTIPPGVEQEAINKVNVVIVLEYPR